MIFKYYEWLAAFTFHAYIFQGLLKPDYDEIDRILKREGLFHVKTKVPLIVDDILVDPAKEADITAMFITGRDNTLKNIHARPLCAGISYHKDNRRAARTQRIVSDGEIYSRVGNMELEYIVHESIKALQLDYSKLEARVIREADAFLHRPLTLPSPDPEELKRGSVMCIENLTQDVATIVDSCDYSLIKIRVKKELTARYMASMNFSLNQSVVGSGMDCNLMEGDTVIRKLTIFELHEWRNLQELLRDL